MRRIVFFLVCALPFVAVPLPVSGEGRLRTSVASFADMGTETDGGLTGLEAAFFFSKALAGFPGLDLKPLPSPEGGDELDRIVVGSYELSDSGLYLSCRYVETKTGETLAEAAVETPRETPRAEAYGLLLDSLLLRTDELTPDFGYRSRAGYLRERWSNRVGEYLRATAALKAGDEAAAVAALERALFGPLLPFPGYSDAARLLTTLRTRTTGAAAALRTNAPLADQFEALSIRHKELLSLKASLLPLLTADAFDLPYGFAPTTRLSGDGAAERIRLPEIAGPFLKGPVRAKLASLFSSAGIAIFGSSGLTSSPVPSGPLLSTESLGGGLDLSVRVSVVHSVRFLDAEGGVLFELVSSPAVALSLGPKEARFAAGGPVSYEPRVRRIGWNYLPDGTVEASAAESAKLKTVRYAVEGSGFSPDVSFPLESESRWKSLLAHAYRLRSAAEVSVKDVVLTDSFFSSPDPALGDVPVLPRNGRLSGFTRLFAVAYVSPRVGDAPSAVWSGAASGTSAPTLNGGEGTVFFEAGEPTDRRYGRVSVSVKSSGDARSVSASALLANGGSWAVKAFPNEFALAGDLVVTDFGVAYSVRDGSVRWESGLRGYPVAYDRGSVLLVGGTALYRLSLATGEVLAENRWQNKGRVFHAARDGDVLYVLSEFGGLESIDAKSGSQNWGARSGGDRVFVLESGFLYGGDGKVYDAKTGALLFYTEGRGSAAVASEVVVWENGVGCDRTTGRRLWRPSGVAGTPIIRGNVAYFGGTAAVDLGGTVLWRRGGGGSDSFLADGTLFAWNRKRLDAIDPSTGTTLWSCYGDRPTARAAGGFLFAAFDEGGLVGYDLSSVSREYSLSGYAERGRLDADLADTGFGDLPARGAYVANVVRGGKAEAAGLQPGDFVLAVDGFPIGSAEEARDRVFALKKDGTFPLKIVRQDPRDGKRSEPTLALRAAGMGDPTDKDTPRPGFRLDMISREELRNRKLDNLARFDSFIVREILPRSPAADAGLAVGDILLQVDSVALDASFLSENFRRLYAAIASALPRRAPVALTVIRNGERRTLPAFRP